MQGQSFSGLLPMVVSIIIILASIRFVAHRGAEDLLTALSCAVLRGLEELNVRRACLTRKSVRVVLGSQRAVRVHFLERPAVATSPGDEHVLLVIPGFACSAGLCMSDLVWKLKPPPSWRVVVMELPLHEANLENFDGAFPNHEGLFLYSVAFAKAVGLIGDIDDGLHLHLCGYSLGARVCMRFLQAHPAHVRKAALIAPAFPEVMDGRFLRCARTEPRRVHAWRTREELREASSFEGMLGCRPGHLLTYSLVQEAMVRAREQTYGREHGDFFANYMAALLPKDQEPSPLDAASLRQVRAPVLLITGERDWCISSDKCREHIRDALGLERCAFHELLDTGHYAAPNNGNILCGAAPICANFLFGD